MHISKQKNKFGPVCQPNRSGHRVEDGWVGRETTSRGLFLVGARDKSTGGNKRWN